MHMHTHTPLIQQMDTKGTASKYTHTHSPQLNHCFLKLQRERAERSRGRQQDFVVSDQRTKSQGG